MSEEPIFLETDVFEHRDVKPHFINPCCFGEDFADWVRQELRSRLDDGFQISAPVQEDYGWGLWVRSERGPFWIAISYVGDGPTEEPAHWAVSVGRDYGLNIANRLFAKPQTAELSRIRTQLLNAIDSNPKIKIIS